MQIVPSKTKKNNKLERFTFELIRPFIASAWLGWYRDLYWTNPLLSFSLKAISPVSSVLTVTIIYSLGAVVGGSFSPERLSYVLVGSALYSHIAMYSSTANLAVAEGKWNFVFPHVFISPKSSPPYIAGRCLASFASSAITMLFSLFFVYYLLFYIFDKQLPLIITSSSLLLLIIALLVNIPATLGLGYMLASYSLLASKFEWALPTYISGLLMIFSEALFPASTLPWPLSLFAESLPFTQFIRASREALIYGSLQNYSYYLILSVLGGLLLLTLGLIIFKAGETRGRKLGIIDKKVA